MMRPEVLYFLEGARFALEAISNEKEYPPGEFGKALMAEAKKRYPDFAPLSEPVKRVEIDQTQ